MAVAGAWGVLRNMLQEFPGFKWAGADLGATAAFGKPAVPAETDAFGSAADGALHCNGVQGMFGCLCVAFLTQHKVRHDLLTGSTDGVQVRLGGRHGCCPRQKLQHHAQQRCPLSPQLATPLRSTGWRAARC